MHGNGWHRTRAVRENVRTESFSLRVYDKHPFRVRFSTGLFKKIINFQLATSKFNRYSLLAVMMHLFLLFSWNVQVNGYCHFTATLYRALQI